MELPEGSSLEATERLALEVTRKVEKVPGVMIVVPSSAGFIDRVTMARITILLRAARTA
ncbi:MAG: hypothetical protein QM757_16205 [Paludibaculum sp.]